MAHKLSFVNTFASNLMKHDSTWTRSEAMKLGWMSAKSGESKLLVFKKKSTGEITRRIVREDWYNFQAPNRGQSNNKPGQMVFADVTKFIAGMPNCIISAYQDSIIHYA